MKLAMMLLSICGTGLAAEDAAALLQRLQSAMAAGDWKQAKDVSAELRAETARRRDQSLAGTNSKFVDEVLGWLPADTETVLVAQQPFTIEPDAPNSIPSAVAMARGYALGLLEVAEGERLAKELAGATVQSVVMAARRFQNHETGDGNILPLGMISYQGCGFYSLAVDQTVFQTPSTEKVLGAQVWISHGFQGDPPSGANPKPDDYYSLIPHPNLVLICNDRDFLTTVLSRMPEASSGPRALPASLPEWKYVDRSQPFWAVRHFDNSRADVDPTNPHNGGVGTEQIEASGLVVEFQPSATFARMIVPAGVTAGDNPWKQLTGAPDFQGEASSRELAKGVWEIKAEGVAQTQFMAVFAFMAQLGFAVLL